MQHRNHPVGVDDVGPGDGQGGQQTVDTGALGHHSREAPDQGGPRKEPTDQGDTSGDDAGGADDEEKAEEGGQRPPQAQEMQPHQ